MAVDDRLPPAGADCLVDVDGRLDAEFAPYRGQIVLVRPDHFVAAAWEPGRMPPLAALHVAGAHDLQPALAAGRPGRTRTPELPARP